MQNELLSVLINGARQKYAGQMIARCLRHHHVRYAYGRDNLIDYQRVQAEAYQDMRAALRRLEQVRR